MTDIVVANIPPAALATAEAGAAYFNSLLYDLYAGRTYKEVEGSDVTPVITGQQGRAADGTERLIYRISLQMHPEWKTSTNKIWSDVLEYAETAVPARYYV